MILKVNRNMKKIGTRACQDNSRDNDTYCHAGLETLCLCFNGFHTLDTTGHCIIALQFQKLPIKQETRETHSLPSDILTQRAQLLSHTYF